MSESDESGRAIQGASISMRDSNSRGPNDSVSEDDEERLSEDQRSWESEDEHHEPEVCPLDCPLRKTYEQVPDVPLPPPVGSLPLSRREAYQLVYGQIKDWQTRLLVLEPGLFGSDLIGSLAIVDTVHLSGAVLHEEQKRVEYTCLSYTWGAQIFPRPIKLDDVNVPITENLFAFLQRFRNRSEACLLWIDALCINQFDLDEKATHVSNMLAVYEKAKSVIVWLGEEAFHTKLAVEYLRWAQGGDLISDMHTQEKWHARVCCDLFTTVLHGIEDLCSRNWARRIWVKQEVWANKAVIVQCGTNTMSWNEYVYGPEVRLGGEGDGIEYVRFASFKLQQHQPRISAEQRNCLQYLRRQHEPKHVWEDDDLPYNEAPHEIFSLLSESADCQMTEDRDRIYALMGMAAVLTSDGKTPVDHTNLLLSVDYRKPIALVFQELAMAIMHHLGAFSILAAIGTFGRHGGLDLPSWTPDFRYQLQFNLKRDYHLRSARPGRKYYPKDERQLRTFRQANLDYECGVLTLQGFRVARITQDIMSSPPQNEFGLAAETHDVIISREWRLFACRTVAPNQSLEQLSLKLMSASLLDWIDEELDRAPRGHRHAFPFQATRRYLEYFDAFAVPCEAVEGDILAFINTVSLPVVLRRVSEDSGRFAFVGCAWLLALQDGLNRGQEDVFREVGIAFSDVYDLEHRKETFQLM